jgi:hypothetical protein
MSRIRSRARGYGSGRALWLGMLAAVGLNVALVGVAASRYPAVLAGGRLPWVVADVAILLAYGAVGTMVVGKGAKAPRLWRAAGLGVAAGAIQSADFAREYLGLGKAFDAGIVPAVVVASTVVLWSIAGAGGDKVGRGALMGLWSSMAAMLMLWMMAWLLGYAFQGRMEDDLASSYQYLHGNTLRDLPAYTVWNTLWFAFSHALLFVAFGTACGAVGAVVASLIARWQGRSHGMRITGARRG